MFTYEWSIFDFFDYKLSMTQPQIKFADAYKKYVAERKFWHISAGVKYMW